MNAICVWNVREMIPTVVNGITRRKTLRYTVMLTINPTCTNSSARPN